MRASIIGAVVGAVISAFIVGGLVVVLVLTGHLDALRTTDALTFAFVVVGVVITALTVVGSFTLIQTWNDIDKRVQAIVEKYERDAQAEIERNAAERQAAINQTAERATEVVTGLTARFTRRNNINTAAMLTLTCYPI